MKFHNFLDEETFLFYCPEDGGGKLLLNVNNYQCDGVISPVSTGGGQPFRAGARGPDILHIFLSLSVVPSSAGCTNEPFQTKPKSLFY
jgi:hypothetical protein